MATIENFILKFKVEGQGAINGVKNSINGLKDDLSALGNVGGPLGNTISSITSKLGPMGAGALGAAAAFAALGMKAVNIADELQDLSDATGIGADQLLNLKQSMLQAGGNAESFAKAASKLNVSIGEAATGNEKYQKSFKDLGVFVTDASGKVRDSGDIMQDVIAKLAAIEDPSVRAAKAVELLGKEAAKIDWSKVSAGKDAVSAEQIAQLAKYREEIEKLQAAIELKLLKSFGELAIAIGKDGVSGGLAVLTEGIGNLVGTILNIPTDAIQGIWNAVLPESLRIKEVYGLGDALKYLSKQAEASRKGGTAEELAANASEMQRLLNRSKAASTGGGSGGGFGAVPEATLKAIQESRNRIELSGIETRKQAELKAATDIQAIQITARYETEKAMKEISARERLSPTQIAEEQAAKRKEIAAKAATDIAKIERQVAEESDRNLAKSRLEVSRLSALSTSDDVKNIQINAANEIAKVELEINARKNMSKEQQELELAARTQEINAKAAFDTLKLRDAAAKSATEQVTALQKTTEELQGRFQLEQGLLDLSTREQERRRAIFEIEKERKAQLEAIAKIPNLTPDARLAKEKELNKTLEDRIDLVNQEAEVRLARENDFSAGIKESMRRYEDSMTPLKRGQQVADSVFNNMTSALDRFVESGKFSFGDLARSIIMDLLKIQLRAAATQLFNSVLGTFGFGLPGLAAGGPVMPNQAYIVGEKGPEVFLPNSAGTIIPNNKLGGQNNAMGGGTTIINNISAIDSRSVAQLFAENRMQLLGTVEQARRELPLRTR